MKRKTGMIRPYPGCLKTIARHWTEPDIQVGACCDPLLAPDMGSRLLSAWNFEGLALLKHFHGLIGKTHLLVDEPFFLVQTGLAILFAERAQTHVGQLER